MRTNLNGRVALVTGSTGGLGRSIAMSLAENGADVVVNGRDPAKGQEVVSSIRSLERRSIFLKADVTDFGQVNKMVSDALEEMGQIDILVASGGGEVPSGFFRELPLDDWHRIIDLQLMSRLYCVKAVLEHMIERNHGKIILVSTDAGRWPTPGESVSCGAAAALVMMTRVLANEFTRWQIRLNTICTTVTEGTPSFNYIMKTSHAPQVFRKALEQTPFCLTTDSVAEAALFFASEESNSITGQTLSVNGGLCFP